MSFIKYEAPQFKCVSIVDMKAAKNDTISIPFKPGPRSVFITRGYPALTPRSLYDSGIIGNITIETTATSIHGQTLNA